MFEQTIKLLLAGEFICGVRHPALYEALRGGDFFDKVDNYVDQIGYKLTNTPEGGAFYLTTRDTNRETKDAAAVVFKEVMDTFRPTLDFFKLVLRATEDRAFLVCGEPVRFAEILTVLQGNPALSQELASIVNLWRITCENTNKERLNRALKKLVDLKYLKEVSETENIYAWTGKVEYFFMASEYMFENAGLTNAEAAEQQETLL